MYSLNICILLVYDLNLLADILVSNLNHLFCLFVPLFHIAYLRQIVLNFLSTHRLSLIEDLLLKKRHLVLKIEVLLAHIKVPILKLLNVNVSLFQRFLRPLKCLDIVLVICFKLFIGSKFVLEFLVFTAEHIIFLLNGYSFVGDCVVLLIESFNFRKYIIDNFLINCNYTIIL